MGDSNEMTPVARASLRYFPCPADVVWLLLKPGVSVVGLPAELGGLIGILSLSTFLFSALRIVSLSIVNLARNQNILPSHFSERILLCTEPALIA